MIAPLPGTTHAECAKAYVGMGMKLVPIPVGQKGPTRPRWNQPGGYVVDPNTAASTWRHPLNMGVVLGPSGLGTLDVDSPEHARIALAAVGIDLDAQLRDGVRIIGNPAKAKVIFRIPEGSGLSTHKLIWPPREERGKAFVVFELRYGPLQDVLPPSVHPETKKPYEWGCAFWENGGIPPVDDQLLKLWREWAAMLPIMEGACPWAPPAAKKEQVPLPSAFTLDGSARGEKLPLDLIGVGFDRCERLSAIRWRATEERHLIHDERIAVTNYCKVFDGGLDWALDAIFRNLSDYDARHTDYQFSKTTGAPPLCSTLCPTSRCDAIKALEKNSPIAFAYQARRDARKSDGPTPGKKEEPVPIFTRCAADIIPKSIKWVWKNRLARGKLTILAGDPGGGKTMLTLAAAAPITLGGRWPAGEGSCEQGEVLIASYEDDPEDTIVPRLHAAGADCSRVHFLEKVPDDKGPRAFDIGRDYDRLGKLLDLHPEARLLVIDPISAAMGGTDAHKNSEVRSLLHPLADIARRHGVAVLGVTHFRKSSGGKALHKVIDSVAFTAAARIAFVATKDQDDCAGERHLFLPIKSNIGDDKIGLSYFKRGVTLPSGIEAWRIEWGEHVTTTADDALGTDEDRGAVNEAKDFLSTVLGDGPVPSDRVKIEARKAKIAERTLWRAKTALRVKARKRSMEAGWTWELPS